ncbi:uncharacterized protein EKO05_0002616 [Ascochyta rabiei]|uniref:Uncharacterized protein n=1 Tax=Didymella rabiei TaxID=5454 RepID=A0A162ZR03_DIDRA|nr:uncharacterized protein EKO05_0002616 [Ascochyta rabiei]KZM20759.1 hypothetical protein ST47_g8069 [Ascochyta rabiei]UPX12039.1 hypothetical protein EKO05_0002616 [Ascochyta rabiei]
MNQFDDLFEFGEDDGLDIPLIADNHLFSNGTDLFEKDLSDWLHEAIDSPHLGNKSLPYSQDVAQEHPPLASSDGAYFEESDDLFQDIDFGDGPMNVSSLPDQPIPQIGNTDLTFDQTFPRTPLTPVLTVDPAVLLNNNMWQPQTESASVPAPDNAFMWHLTGTNKLIPMPGSGQQQQWPVFANQQVQLHQPQPSVAQIQYMQAVQQFQFAQNQLALSMQPPVQSPMNAQLPPDQQIFQQAHGSLQPQTLLYQEPEPAQDVQALQITPIEVTPPELSPIPPTALQTAAITPSEQQEGPSNPPRSRASRKARVNRTSDRTQDAHTPKQSYGRLTFISLREAEAAMPGRYLEKNWQAPSPDETVPDTNEDRAYWVLKILDAMQDTSTCKDNKDGFSFVKRWRNAGYYNIQEMEKVCWQMVDVAERLHAQGPSVMNIYCHDAHKKLHASRSLTFEQRIVAICDMLKLSKFLCDNLMKGEGTEALVGAPKQKMSGARTMARQNLKRQNWLEEGRRKDADRLKGKTDVPEDEQDVLVNKTNVPQPTSRKPKQKYKRSAPASKPLARAVTSEDPDEEESHELSRRQSIPDSPTNESNHTTSPVSPSPFPTSPSWKKTYAIRGHGLGRSSPHRATPPMEPGRKFNGMSRKRAIDLTESDSDEETPSPPSKRMQGPKNASKKRFEGPVRRTLRSAGHRDTDEMEIDEASQDEASREEDAEHEIEGDEDEGSEVESCAPSKMDKNKLTTSIEEPDVSESEAQSDQADTEAETSDNNSDDDQDEEPEDSEESKQSDSDPGSEFEPSRVRKHKRPTAAPPAKRANKGSNEPARKTAQITSSTTGKPFYGSGRPAHWPIPRPWGYASKGRR